MTATSVTGLARRFPPRSLWLLACLAAAVSLGMGWDSYIDTYTGTEVYLTPGSNVILADGTYEYTPGMLLVFPTFDYESGFIPGYASHLRVLLPGAAWMLVIAVRRRSRSLARMGLAVAALAPLLAGGFTQGAAVFLIGLGCAALALQAHGLIELPRRRF